MTCTRIPRALVILYITFIDKHETLGYEESSEIPAVQIKEDLK